MPPPPSIKDSPLIYDPVSWQIKKENIDHLNLPTSSDAQNKIVPDLPYRPTILKKSLPLASKPIENPSTVTSGAYQVCDC